MDKHAHVRHPKEVVQEAKNSRRRDNKLLYFNDIVLRVDYQPRPRLGDPF